MKNKKGISLLEAVLYIGVGAFIITVISAFFIILIQGRVKNETIREINQQGIFIMNEITKTIRNADGVSIPTKGATNTVLSLQMSEALKNPTVFSMEGQILYVQEGSSSAIPLNFLRQKMQNLVFKNLSQENSPPIIQIEFTLVSSNTSGRNEYQFQKIFRTSVGLKK